MFKTILNPTDLNHWHQWLFTSEIVEFRCRCYMKTKIKKKKKQTFDYFFLLNFTIINLKENWYSSWGFHSLVLQTILFLSFPSYTKYDQLYILLWDAANNTAFDSLLCWAKIMLIYENKAQSVYAFCDSRKKSLNNNSGIFCLYDWNKLSLSGRSLKMSHHVIARNCSKKNMYQLVVSQDVCTA